MRAKDIINSKKPGQTLLVSGNKGAGKSVFDERAGERHKLDDNWLVLDGYGSGDKESLYWAVSENMWRLSRGLDELHGRETEGHYKGEVTADIKYNIAVINPVYVDMKIPEPLRESIKTYTTKDDFAKVYQTCSDENRVIVFNNAVFDSNHALKALNDIFENILELSDTRKCFILLREVADLLPQKDSKIHNLDSTNQIFKVCKESRHYDVNMVLDVHRIMSVHHNVRSFGRNIIKNTPLDMLPPKLEWLPKRLNNYRIKAYNRGWPIHAVYAKYPPLGGLRQDQFYVVYSSNLFKLCRNRMPFFHHKAPGDKFEDITGIEFIRDARKMRDELRYMAGATNFEEWMKNIQEVFHDGKKVRYKYSKKLGGDEPYAIMMELMEHVDWPHGPAEFKKLCHALRELGILRVKEGVITLRGGAA